MKTFKIYSSETVLYETIVEAESEDIKEITDE